MIGFTGSRRLPGRFKGKVTSVVRTLIKAEMKIGVGCARGLDEMVRSACPEAVVFRAESQKPQDLVERSVNLVTAVALSLGKKGFIVFADRPCPDKLFPSSVVEFCFNGSGSGTWATAALAVGRNVPIIVFGLQLQELPKDWGKWSPAGDGCWTGGFRLEPEPKQLHLFNQNR